MSTDNSNATTVTSVEDQTATFRELREYARGTLDVEHEDVHPIAGMIDDEQVAEDLMFMAEVYDPSAHPDLPASFWETELARQAVRKYGTHKATEAIDEGNLTQASYISGLPSYKSDVSGLHAINQLADWLVHSEQCKLIYCAALMGNGKTDFSLLLFEIIHDHYQRIQKSVDAAVSEPEFASNFSVNTPSRVDSEFREFHSYSELKRWADKGSSDDNRWFIFDEASTELTAQSGANAQDVAEVFAPFVKKMRKSGVNMIVIGHDRQDVHPAIRAIASFIDKTGLKSAEVYEGIRSREPYGHVMSISGIPETGWAFDTDDVAEWEWDEAVDDGDVDDHEGITEEEWRKWRDQRIAKIYTETDLSQSDVGDCFDVSQGHVSGVVRNLDKNEDVARIAPESPEASAD